MITPGRYRHYKGHDYEVIGVARHSETEESFVVYRALYGERGLWVRPAAMFLDTVTVDGRSVLRFTRLPVQPSERTGDVGLSRYDSHVQWANVAACPICCRWASRTFQMTAPSTRKRRPLRDILTPR